MPDKINLEEKFALFHEHWKPKIVGEINSMHVKIVKLQGEFIWHSHDVEDEMFFVVKGSLTMNFRDRSVEVGPGEFIIIPHTVEHMPFCKEETHVMLVEPMETINTGGQESDRTYSPEKI